MRGTGQKIVRWFLRLCFRGDHVRVRLTFVRSVARPVPRAEAAAARRLQRMCAGQRSANCNRRDAVALAIAAGSSAAGPKPGRVNCSEKLGGALTLRNS